MSEIRKRKWIKGAIKHPGALREAAHNAGESTHQYAEQHKHDSGKTGARARLALTLMSMHHKGAKKSPEKKHTYKEARSKMYGKREGK